MTQARNYSYFDKNGSTFISKIFCTTGVVLTGYSKTKSSKYNEPDDKTVQLEKWIIRLKDKNYLNANKVEKIGFFLNKNGYEETCFLILYPTHFAFNTKINAPIDNIRLKAFLTVLYKNPNIDIQPHKPNPINEDKIFELSSRRFKDEFELFKFCMIQSKNQFQESRIFSFYNEYKRRFL